MAIARPLIWQKRRCTQLCLSIYNIVLLVYVFYFYKYIEMEWSLKTLKKKSKRKKNGESWKQHANCNVTCAYWDLWAMAMDLCRGRVLRGLSYAMLRSLEYWNSRQSLFKSHRLPRCWCAFPIPLPHSTHLNFYYFLFYVVILYLSSLYYK